MTDTKNVTTLESLDIQRLLPAPPERVFDAWTDANELKKWWGPRGVSCLCAEIDLRVGGKYRIANQLPDGTVLWIGGEFEVIEKPHLLIFTWVVETESPTTERVTVRFEKHQQGTELVLRHELISGKAIRDQHLQGWLGCMDGLVNYLDKSVVSTNDFGNV